MDFLEYLKQDPGCLYIYNWGPYIYGLEKEPSIYIVVVIDAWKNPEGYNFPSEPWGIYAFQKDGIGYFFYRMKYWFDKVLLGDIDTWECACMNKKFIIKEHVKLMMKTNPLQLRKNVDALKYTSDTAIEQASVYELWSRIKDCKFALQIIDNHKIVNPKEANKDYELLMNASDKAYTFKKLIEVPYQNLRLKTDDLLRRSKIEKILQKKKNE